MICLVSGLFFLFSPLVSMLHVAYCSDDLMIYLVSGLFFLFSPLVSMLHCSDDLLSIWIVLLVLSPSLYVAL